MKDPNQIISIHKETGRVHVATINKDPSLTQQQFKDECDINNIIKKYETTGEFTHLTRKQGQYADFSNITDYQTMLETVKYADEAFAALPAQMRLRFKNNPGDLLNFLQDKNNYDEAVKLGLIEPKLPDPQKQTEKQKSNKTQKQNTQQNTDQNTPPSTDESS